MSLHMQAEDFFNAYQVLHDHNHAAVENLSNSAGKTFINSEKLDKPHTGSVDIVCLAFSVELYIKDLICAVKGKAPHEHDILKLFKKLPDEIQQEIYNHSLLCQNPFFARGDILLKARQNAEFSFKDGIIEKIKEISDGFTKWRYAHEGTMLRYDVSFALAFIESIRSTTEKVRRK